MTGDCQPMLVIGNPLNRKMQARGCDDFGSGEFAASRGRVGAVHGRVYHKGVDVLAEPGEQIYAAIGGQVRLGYPYGDDLSYRYVAVRGPWAEFRHFYVDPVVSDHEIVAPGAPIGTVQDVGKRYNREGRVMLNHIHLDLRIIARAMLDNEALDTTARELWVDLGPILLRR